MRRFFYEPSALIETNNNKNKGEGEKTVSDVSFEDQLIIWPFFKYRIEFDPSDIVRDNATGLVRSPITDPRVTHQVSSVYKIMISDSSSRFLYHSW